jgi:hypothetical protein
MSVSEERHTKRERGNVQCSTMRWVDLADFSVIGCFQCSKRRINCDRAEPSCAKCIKKGIQCSGLARIRFNEGVARRGRLKNCAIPVLGFASQDGDISHLLPTEVAFPELQWNSYSPPRKPRARRNGTTKRRTRTAPDSPAAAVGQPEAVPYLSSEPPITDYADTPSSDGSAETPGQLPRQLITPREVGTFDEEIETYFQQKPQKHQNQLVNNSYSIMPWIAPIPSGTRGLFYHCKRHFPLLNLNYGPQADGLVVSEAVAPVMVILDKVSNGYREFILPMALQDEVLCRAVTVVAAQHLSQGNPALELAAEKGRTAVISRLRRDASLESRVFNEFTWATLIVLLVGETVTGNADYSFLVQMLLCLSSNNVISTKESPITQFLRTQTHM